MRIASIRASTRQRQSVSAVVVVKPRAERDRTRDKRAMFHQPSCPPGDIRSRFKIGVQRQYNARQRKLEAEKMSEAFKYRILLVDDDEGLLETTAAILSREGYVVHTARDGFEAVAALRGSIPEIIISDLKMPNMSGFELLAVVRKRFPAVGVIALSGEFSPLTSPEGVLADRFVSKGDNSNFELVEAVRELIMQLPVRGQQARSESAPAWLPRSAKGYVVVTCPICLRSFSVSAPQIQFGVVRSDSCIHCGADVQYRIDSTVAADAGRPTSAEEAQKRINRSRQAIEDSKKMIPTERGRRG